MFDSVGTQSDSRNLQTLVQGMEILGIKPEKLLIANLVTFHDLLLAANSNHNLTRIIEWPDVVARHYLDSLSIIMAMPSLIKGKESILDVGSGFGMPGIALNVVFPENEMIMVDSAKKKIEFIDSVINKMGLRNVTTAWGRAEDLAKCQNHRERYTLVVSRAVATLPVLLELTLPFCRVGGLVVAVKGPRVQDEIYQSINALGKLGGRIEEVLSVKDKLPFLSTHLVLVRKTSETPTNFPRRSGIPKKRPL